MSFNKILNTNERVTGLPIMLVLCGFGILLAMNGILVHSNEAVYFGFAAILITTLFLTLRNNFYLFFFIITLTTEFYYIHVSDGTLRPYHFVAPLIILCLIRYCPLLIKSSVFWTLTLFVFVNLIAVAMSDMPGRAFNSLLLLLANISVALATALIFLSNRINFRKFTFALLVVTLVGVVWGIIQIGAFRIFGTVLALSQEQETQILLGLAPVFRTEADTFGKFMVFPIMFFLPELIEFKTIRRINFTYIFFLFIFLLNFIRSSIYGILLSTIFVLFWYFYKRKLFLLSSRGIIIGALIFMGIVMIKYDMLPSSDYSQHKINNIINPEEILYGGSSEYRLASMKLVVNNALANNKSLFIGKGWGETYNIFRRQLVQAGGGDVINVLGYSGLIGVAAYLLYSLISLVTVCKAAQRGKNPEEVSFAEGIAFAIVGIFCTAQMSGYLIAPEYWILVGISIYLSVKNKQYGPRATN